MLNFFLKHKLAVVNTFLIAAIISAVLAFGVEINYNISDYLPRDSNSTKALNVMNEEFNSVVPNGKVMITNASISQIIDYKLQLLEIDGITQVLWLDDVIDIYKPLEIADPAIVETYYHNDNALLSIAVNKGDETRVLNEIYDLIGENNSVSGDFVDTATQQKMASKETSRAMFIAVPIIILILLLNTSSWIEPILFLLTIGVSVIINLGTNIFFKDVSFITQSITPILQMAVSLDYAIFLLSSFEKYRNETSDITKAMSLAVKRSVSTILASATTTLFGFVALLFMRFRIGSDLGIVLVKGIVFSFIGVVVFLPALTLFTYKLIDKTRHKKIIPDFKGIGKFIVKVRFLPLILVLILILPAFMAQRNNTFLYGLGSELAESSRSGLDTVKINETFGISNPIVILVPRGNFSKEEELTKKLEQTRNITSVISYSNTVSNNIPSEFLNQDILDQFYSENYSRIIVTSNTDAEGDEAFNLVSRIKDIAYNLYKDKYLMLGLSVNLYDIKDVVEKDTPIINAIAILSIAITLLITFKSLLLPILLVLTIETSIWINLSIPYFSGSLLCYIGYLVISTVQLGATVDYAILLTDHYLYHRNTKNKIDTIIAALGETSNSIFVSGFILASAGFSLGFISTDQIISELGILLGRGTLLSMVMVLFFLPALLALFDNLILKTTFTKKKEVNDV